ncbi:LysR family transcriptional regulator [Streptomyces sp. NEAU-Y11]|uniref:LysR family transcriptional regulator n=1 Tax=Streptomyces cucumeris TaxID=2962890 RepID=UPI0020C89391|nr:LysR family transcriptional regulator [Streptomyces sp. NEAU-Y11]MCP9211574.1 LysR family transcriptional regulator [Streptomyces sp. NEAU-Y11]
MNLEVKHLRALCAIADNGSLRKAARELGMTQPSLTTQLLRIEKTLGGRLFSREVTGSRPTPLGQCLLSRARPIVAEMSALISQVQREADQKASAWPRVGSTGNRAVAGWLRRLRKRYPEAEPGIHIDLSANTLLKMVAGGQLDAAFVHEAEGVPLNIPTGLDRRVLVTREPQFVALADSHPLAGRPEVDLADLAAAQWMIDPAMDSGGAGLQRAFSALGLNPRVVYGDYANAMELVASGEVVTHCQPTERPRQGVAIRPLHRDPLAVRLLLVWPKEPTSGRHDATPGATGSLDIGALFDDLDDAYSEIAWASGAYREWLVRNESPLSRPHDTQGPEAEPGLGPARPADAS